MCICGHLIRIVHIGDSSLQTDIIRLSGLPVVHEVRSHRTGTPSLSEWECFCVVLTTTYTEMQSDTISITDGCAPRSQFVELDSEHSLGVHGIVVFHPSETFTFGVRIVFNNLIVGVGPKIAEIRNKRVTRVVHAIVDSSDNILLGQRSPVRQFHRSQWIISRTNQVGSSCTIAIHTCVIEPSTTQHSLCGIFVDTAISTFYCWQQFYCITQIL